jgi:hypothetical protein
MVWKKGKQRKGDSQGNNKLASVPEEAKIKAHLKPNAGPDQESSHDSSKNQGGDSSTRDYYKTSVASRSVGSRSGDSRCSGSASARWTMSVEQESCDSGASLGSSERESKKSDRGSPSQGSERSSPSKTSQREEANHRRRVRFDKIQIRDYERVVGDNPSCTIGPPIG